MNASGKGFDLAPNSFNLIATAGKFSEAIWAEGSLWYFMQAELCPGLGLCNRTASQVKTCAQYKGCLARGLIGKPYLWSQIGFGKNLSLPAARARTIFINQLKG